MNHTIVTNAALFSQALSIMKMKPIHERISNFMSRSISRNCNLALLLTICTFGASMNAQCDFPDVIDGLSCESSLYLCNDLIDGYVGTLPATNPEPQFANLCASGGTIENPVWFSFIPCETSASITIIPSNCQPGVNDFLGIQVAIYSDCMEGESVTCFDDGSDQDINLSFDSFIPGNIYYLIVDGYGGSVCDFTIDVISGICNDEFTIDTENPADNSISGPSGDFCNLPDVVYSYEISDCDISSVSGEIDDLYENGWTCYEWTILPNTFQFLGASDGPYIDIQFLAEDNYTISVERHIHPFLLACADGLCEDPQPINISVDFIDTIIETTFLCPGEFVDICGDMIGVEGVFSCLDEDACVLKIDTIKIGGGEIEELGNIYLCPEQCFTIEGIEYCDRDDYSVISSLDCSKTIEFSIKDYSLSITPSDYPVITCANNIVKVQHSIVTNYSGNLGFTYYNAAGMEISTGLSADIDAIGNYYFVVSSEDFSGICGDTVFFNISSDFSTPDFTTTSEILTCSDQIVDLSVISTDDIIAYEWDGPGASSLLQDDLVTVEATAEGTYSVTVTGSNGCTSTQTLEVESDFPPVEVEISWQDLDCNVAQTTLSYLSEVTVDSILWTGAGDFEDSNPSPTTMVPGMYTLTLFATSGCDYKEVFEILGNFQDPEITALPIDEWACKTEELTVQVQYDQNENYSFNWTSPDGLILDDSDALAIAVGSIGSYIVEITDNETGCTALDTLEVIANSEIPTAIDLDAESPLCFSIDDGRIEIFEVEGGVGPFIYFVDGQVTPTLIEDLPPAQYEILAIDANGCEVTEIVEIIAPGEFDAQINGPADANYEDIVDYKADIVSSVVISEINWYNQENELIGTGESLSFTLLQDEIITLEVIDENGCIIIRTIPIVLDEDFNYYLPTAFTPNQDGMNDYFGFFSQNLPGEIIEFTIYDRWGSKVYQVENIENGTPLSDWGWNGMHQGRAAQQGVYVYLAIVETLGVEKQLKGNVTLTR